MAWPGETTAKVSASSHNDTSPLRIVMLCTGNICRSPLAEQLLTAEAQSFSLPLDVSSAGTHAMIGGSPPAEIEHLLESYGAPPTHHTPRQLSAEMILGADLVLTATREHRRFSVSMVPPSATSTFTLNQFVRLLEGHAVLVASGEREGPRSPRDLVRALADIRGLVLPADHPEDDDIADPYRSTRDAYNVTGSQILTGIRAISSALRDVS